MSERLPGHVTGYSWSCPECLDGEAADYEFFIRRSAPTACSWCGNSKIARVTKHNRLDATHETRDALARALTIAYWSRYGDIESAPDADELTAAMLDAVKEMRAALDSDAVLGPVEPQEDR